MLSNVSNATLDQAVAAPPQYQSASTAVQLSRHNPMDTVAGHRFGAARRQRRQRLQEPENQGHCGGLRLGPGVHADRPTSSHGFCRSEAADLGCLRSEPRLSTSDQRPKFAEPPRAVGSPFTASAATHLRRDQSSQFQKSGLRYRTGFRLVRTPVRPAGPRLVSRSRRSQIVDQGSDAEISVEHVRPMFL